MDATAINTHEFVVQEVIPVSGYTYLRVLENKEEKWLATNPIDAKVGETYYYEGGFEMTNFKSKELDRVFEKILFLEGISKEPILHAEGEKLISPGASVVKEAKKEIKVPVAEGGITISELFAKKEMYKGKKVKISAEVTKFSPEIMGTNWIHVQDGTDFNGSFDLAITSDAEVKVGDIVTFEGPITLDKDLGYGYFFDVLMEEAKLVK